MALVRLQNLVPQAAGKYGIAGEIQAARVCHIFRKLAEQMVGPEIASRIDTQTFKNHILWVTIQGSSAMQALQLQKHLILEKIQKDAPEVKLEDIRIR